MWVLGRDKELDFVIEDTIFDTIKKSVRDFEIEWFHKTY